ncbi:MAG: MerR family transcriptional regulator [Planctomycetota bacterium]
MAGPGPHHRLRSIGKALKDEESRFIGYAEIERKSKELGFGMSVRTLRFYVDEGILPPPKKVGKTPVYEEEWILNVLLSIHLMKTRFNRSLTEIRLILGSMREPPERLADKLSVLYEDYGPQGGALSPLERAGLLDAFFDLLSGKHGDALQASEVRLGPLVDVISQQGVFEGEAWIPPAPAAVLASQGYAAPGAPPPAAPPASPPTAAAPAAPTRPQLTAPSAPAAPAPAAGTAPGAAAERVPLASEAPGSVTARAARASELAFLQRFKTKFERLGRVHCPIDNKGYKAGPREHVFVKQDRSTEVIELMKQLRVYDRSLLDSLPLDEMREFRVSQRGLFGRGDLKVVVTALSLSPLDELVRQRWSARRLTALDAKRALDEMELRDGVFHYVGILSTTGWRLDGPEQIPTRRNLLACLVESNGSGAWKVHHVPDDAWGGVEMVFDPETAEEKVERVRTLMEAHLRPRGEFIILRNLCEDLDVPRPLVQTALDQLLAADPELTLLSTGGREIVKRSRL